MKKLLTYIVAIAILAILGADAYLAITGKATPHTIVELAVGGGAILAIAVTAFVKAVGGISWHRNRKVTIDEVDDKVDTLYSKVDDIDSRVDDINETIDSRLGPEPDGFVATINTTDDNGKIVRLYDLPVSDTYNDAIQAARESLQARTDEGNPVDNAKVTVVPVYEL